MKESQTKRFCSCIKKVRQTLKASKESGAIAICVKSVLQKQGRTLKKFRCKGNKARVLTQPRLTRRQGGGPSAAKSHSGSYADPSKYFITLEPDGTSIRIHRPNHPITVREGDQVVGIEYIDSTRKIPFKLKTISIHHGEMTKLTFAFIDSEGKSASPVLHLDGKRVKFSNLRRGISVGSHLFAQIAKHIHKIH